MTEQHKHAAFLRAIADGEPLSGWECRSVGNTEWGHATFNDVEKFVNNPNGFITRRKPRAIRIGNMDVPEPLRVAPEMGATFWLVLMTYETSRFEWVDNRVGRDWLKRGLVHSTQEAAEQHRRALILVSGGTP